MNSPQKPNDNAVEAHLVREGGVRYRAAREADGFESWINLMEAIEALCPRWPGRPPPTNHGQFLL
jgi:hypothetical protein